MDNSVLLRSSENNDDDLVRVVPDLPAATAPGNTQSSDGAAPPEPSKTDLMPLKDLVELASRVLERHSMELEAPSRSQKFLRASAPKREQQCDNMVQNCRIQI